MITSQSIFPTLDIPFMNFKDQLISGSFSFLLRRNGGAVLNGLFKKLLAVQFSTSSDMDDVREELKNFLLYLKQGSVVDEFTMELEKEVETAKGNRGWEAELLFSIVTKYKLDYN